MFFSIQWKATFLIGQDFWAGGKIIPIIAISYFLYGVFILQMPSIYLQNKQNWVPLFWGAGALINFIINLLLIPSWGFFGAALATFFSYLSMLLFLMYKNHRWYKLKYRLDLIVFMILISLCMILFVSLICVPSFVVFFVLVIYIIFSLSFILRLQSSL